MDHRPHERTGQGLHGVVTARLAFALVVAAALLAGMAGGLVRAGALLDLLPPAGWLPRAVLGHAFLMVSAFLGTVIGLERAVALKHPAAFAAPAASGVSGVLLLAGRPEAAAWLALIASAAFVAVNAVIVSRQRAAHTALLLVAAVAWWVGAALHALGGVAQGTLSWWFAFLVLTIAAERLEMTRLMRRRPGASGLLLAVLGTLLGGAALSSVDATAALGGIAYGLALLALSIWLFAFDIARKTVAAQGLSRYMAVCLLLGYGWLAVAGLAWAGTSLGLPMRDAALHGLALGFVFSMIFGHAPVILPALVRAKLAFSWWFYLPLAVLHLSLAARLLLSTRLGSIGNAAAIVSFVLAIATAAIAWRRQHRAEALNGPRRPGPRATAGRSSRRPRR